MLFGHVKYNLHVTLDIRLHVNTSTINFYRQSTEMANFAALQNWNPNNHDYNKIWQN